MKTFFGVIGAIFEWIWGLMKKPFRNVDKGFIMAVLMITVGVTFVAGFVFGLVTIVKDKHERKANIKIERNTSAKDMIVKANFPDLICTSDSGNTKIYKSGEYQLEPAIEDPTNGWLVNTLEARNQNQSFNVTRCENYVKYERTILKKKVVQLDINKSK